MATKTPLGQNIFGDDQEFVNPDIDKLYKNIIQEIDTFRSHFPINVAKNMVAGALTKANASKDLSKIYPDANPQESRLNCFYRMLGLPVISTKNNLYSPGYDKSINSNSDLQAQIENVTNGFSKDDLKLFLIRDQFNNNVVSNFFTKQTKEATAIGVTMAAYPIIYNTIGDDNFTNKINYSNENSTLFATDFYLNFYNSSTKEYVDPDLLDKLITHTLTPTCIDPRVDFTVTPAQNSLCCPFLKNGVDSNFAPNITLKRTFLERIIALRCGDLANNTKTVLDNSAYISSINDFINEQSSITNERLVNINADLNKMSNFELQNLGRYLQIINSLITKLYLNSKQIQKIIGKIDFQPVFDKRGPEFGGTLNEVTIDLVTARQIENEIVELTIKNEVDNLLSTIKSSTESSGTLPDSNSYAISADSFVYNKSTNINKIQETQLSKLTKQRDNLGKQGISLVRENEIITGTFSGLGLIDIMAMIAALWLLDRNQLVWLIDDRSFNRLYDNKALRCKEIEDRKSSGARPDKYAPLTLINSYNDKIKQILNIAKQFYANKDANL